MASVPTELPASTRSNTVGPLMARVIASASATRMAAAAAANITRVPSNWLTRRSMPPPSRSSAPSRTSAWTVSSLPLTPDGDRAGRERDRIGIGRHADRRSLARPDDRHGRRDRQARMQDDLGHRPGRLGDLPDQPGKIGDRSPEQLDRMPFRVGDAHADRGKDADDRARHAGGDQHRRVVSRKREPEGEQEARQTEVSHPHPRLIRCRYNLVVSDRTWAHSSWPILDPVFQPRPPGRWRMYLTSSCVDYFTKSRYESHLPCSSRGVFRRRSIGGARCGVPRLRLVTAAPGGPGHRPPGTTTWLRGASLHGLRRKCRRRKRGPRPKIATVETVCPFPCRGDSPSMQCEGYPDRPGRASRKEGES